GHPVFVEATVLRSNRSLIPQHRTFRNQVYKLNLVGAYPSWLLFYRLQLETARSIDSVFLHPYRYHDRCVVLAMSTLYVLHQPETTRFVQDNPSSSPLF